MTNIRHYIAESQRTYRYRIKSIVPLDNKAMDKLELALAKYKVLNVERAKKTLLQTHPLDFPNVSNAEVYYSDVELGLPASSYVLQMELRAALNTAADYVVVRGEDEPQEVEGERIVAERDIEAEATKRNLTPKALLATGFDEDPAIDGEDYYGEKYNSRLIRYLKQVQEERPDSRVAAVNPLFGWLEMPRGVNALGNSPTVDPKGYDPNLSRFGNYIGDREEMTKRYVDDNGKTVKISRSLNPIRKERT